MATVGILVKFAGETENLAEILSLLAKGVVPHLLKLRGTTQKCENIRNNTLNCPAEPIRPRLITGT